eukprot:2144683-Amphidinium_carterae.1
MPRLKVTVPEKKLQEIRDMIYSVLRSTLVTRTTLLRLAGKLSFAAGAAPQLRPFIQPLWAVTTGVDTSRISSRHIIHTKRVSASLRCLLGFLKHVEGAL